MRLIILFNFLMCSTKIEVAPLSLVIIRAGATHQLNRLLEYVDLLKVCQASDVNSTSTMLRGAIGVAEWESLHGLCMWHVGNPCWSVCQKTKMLCCSAASMLFLVVIIYPHRWIKNKIKQPGWGRSLLFLKQGCKTKLKWEWNLTLHREMSNLFPL